MTPEEAPAGTVVSVGANGKTATKQVDGDWTDNLAPHAVVHPEDIARLGSLLFRGH